MIGLKVKYDCPAIPQDGIQTNAIYEIKCQGVSNTYLENCITKEEIYLSVERIKQMFQPINSSWEREDLLKQRELENKLQESQPKVENIETNETEEKEEIIETKKLNKKSK